MLTDDIKLPELVATTIPGYSAPFDRLVTAAYAEQYAVAAVIADREARAAAQAKRPAVSHMDARQALEDMDDCARMSRSIEPIGAYKTLLEYIHRMEALTDAPFPEGDAS